MIGRTDLITRGYCHCHTTEPEHWLEYVGMSMPKVTVAMGLL